MKNLIKKLVVIVLVFTTYFNYGNTNIKLENSLTILNNTKLKVVFKDVKKGQILTVKDKNGIELYSEKVTLNGKLVKILDLSFLKNGNYNIELEKDFQIVVNKIRIENNRIIFEKNNRTVIYKPIIKSKENLLMISKIAFDEKPLKLAIYYKNEVIYSETLKNNSIIKKAYRLQKDIEGPYKVILYNNNRTYTHNFNI